MVHGSGVSRFVCRGVRSCTGPKLVATRALPLSLCSLCPCSLCLLVHLDGGPHHLICCASPPVWLLARLSARGGAAGSAGRVVPGTQPGRGGATLGPPLVSLGSQSLWVSTALRCRLCADRRRTGTCTCGYAGHGRVPRGSLLCGGCPALEGSPSASWSSARPSFPCAHPRFASP